MVSRNTYSTFIQFKSDKRRTFFRRAQTKIARFSKGLRGFYSLGVGHVGDRVNVALGCARFLLHLFIVLGKTDLHVV